MTNKRFQVFKKPNDHRNWDKQIEYASIADDISEVERQNMISALQFLKTKFGAILYHLIKLKNSGEVARKMQIAVEPTIGDGYADLWECCEGKHI